MNFLIILAPLVFVLTTSSISLPGIDNFSLYSSKEIKSQELSDISNIDFSTGAFSSDQLKIGTPKELRLANFEKWAEERSITLIGTNKNAKSLFKSAFNPIKDKIELKEIPGVILAAESLYKIPDEVLEVMKGKTIYFSDKKGRSKSIHAAWGKNPLDRGFILEQPIIDRNVIHELGHIVDVHGVQGAFNDKQNVFNYAKENRDKIFHIVEKNKPSSNGPPPGFISSYSSSDDLENFAEHFSYYVMKPNEFREKMKKDLLLIDEYEFFRDFIFKGKEY